VNGDAKPKNCPFCFGHMDLCLIHPSLVRPHSPPQTTDRSVHALPHKYATNSPLIKMGCRKFTPKNCPSPSMTTTPSNTSIPRPTPLTIPNGIWIHSAVLPQYTFWTHRPTDGTDECSVRIPHMLAILMERHQQQNN